MIRSAPWIYALQATPRRATAAAAAAAAAAVK